VRTKSHSGLLAYNSSRANKFSGPPDGFTLSLNLITKLHSTWMVLKAEQHSQIAAAYETAAADGRLPAQTRAAFAKKADWFRLLARVEEKRERAARIASEAKQKAQEPPPNPFLAKAKPRRWRFAGRFCTELGEGSNR
jgi:hypothetical protein